MFLKHQIRIISEGSCDAVDWNNNAENSALQNILSFLINIIVFT